MLHYRIDVKLSSASASTLQGTDCCFYYVFEIQLFLRPELLHYREQTVACITCLKFNCFFGLSFYVTANGLLHVLRVRNTTVSSASDPTLQGTDCCFYYVFEIQLFLRPHYILHHQLSAGLGARKYVLAAPCIFATWSQPSVNAPWTRRHNSSSKCL